MQMVVTPETDWFSELDHLKSSSVCIKESIVQIVLSQSFWG